MMTTLSINWDLLPLKVIMFLWWGAYTMMAPFIPVHMKQVGISVTQTMIIYTCLPVFQIASQPALGLLADRKANYQLLMVVFLVTYGVSSTAMFFVPSSFPEDVPYVTEPEWNRTGKPDGHFLNQSWSTPIPSQQQQADSEGSPLTFWSYFVLRVLVEMSSSAIFMLIDSSAVIMVESHNAAYGKQRLWGIVGCGVFPPLTGYLMDAVSDGGKVNFSPVYYASDGVMLLVGILAFKMNFALTRPARNIFQNLKALVTSARMLVFLVALLCLGTLWGYTEIFLFLYMRHLGSPSYLLGLTMTVSTVCGLPFLFYSDWFLRRVGHVPLLIVSFLAYGIRCFGYSFVELPGLCLIFEALELFTYHLFWVAAVTYAVLLSPPDLVATVQGTIGAVHYGLGIGTGSLFGGLLIRSYGTRTTYRVMGGFALGAGALYALFHWLDERRDQEQEEQERWRRTRTPTVEPTGQRSPSESIPLS